MRPSHLLRTSATFAILLALFVVMLGAYTRLTDAGLGCPDWPGCYGHIVLPDTISERMQAQHLYPNAPIEAKKAWTEMAHRYVAGTLAVLILSLFFLARHTSPPQKTKLPWLLLGLVVFQAALGMWTVTLKLLPVVVMGHLLGGLLIFATLCYLRWQISTYPSYALPRLQPWIRLAVILIFCQIALGGWVSSNYAGIACIGFPRCNGTWLPTLDFAKAFQLFSPLHTNYQGGLLDNTARVTIQWVHRIGAVVTATYVLILSITIIRIAHARPVRRMAALVLLLIFVQFTLGIINVTHLLPLGIAVAHNGVAALLLGSMVSLHYLCGGHDAHST